jgi:hypothetical protein
MQGNVAFNDYRILENIAHKVQLLRRRRLGEGVWRLLFFGGEQRVQALATHRRTQFAVAHCKIAAAGRGKRCQGRCANVYCALGELATHTQKMRNSISWRHDVCVCVCAQWAASSIPDIPLEIIGHKKLEWKVWTQRCDTPFARIVLGGVWRLLFFPRSRNSSQLLSVV